MTRVAIIALVFIVATDRSWAIGEFYANRAEGWFWYRQDSLVLEDAVLKQTDRPEAQPQPFSPTASDVLPLSAAWFRENFSKYKDAAIDNPTASNIAAYLYLQCVMLDKANRFTDNVQRHVVTDPYLDEVTRRPITTFAANEVNKETGRLREEHLRLIAQKAGIFFFFLSDCRYCHLQAPVLARLADVYGFEIFPISLDGRPMSNGLFERFRVDQGQARQLGVVSTPAMFLAHPPDNFIPIAQGAVSMDEIVNRILMASVQAGWLEEKDYQQTRPLATQAMLDDTHLPANAVTDPDRLVEFLRNRLRSAR